MARNGDRYWINPKTGKFEIFHSSRQKYDDAPMISVDEMAPIESPISETGEIFTSKSKYRRHLKQNGFVDVGHSFLKEQMAKPKRGYKANREEIVQDIYEAERKLKYGMAPLSDLERAEGEREEREYADYVKRRRG